MDDAHFKEAMSRFASGVTVVTTEHEGVLFGMTVASFASLSLHPPLVLVCVAKAAKSHEAIRATEEIRVSILAFSQSELSRRRIEVRGQGFLPHLPPWRYVYRCSTSDLHVECACTSISSAAIIRFRPRRPRTQGAKATARHYAAAYERSLDSGTLPVRE